MNDAEKAYQFFVIAVPENEEQAKAYFWARKALQPTLTPPNEWVSVEERLPEPTYCVLVYTTDYSIEVDALDSDGEWMSYEVTHWMSLPEPPDRRPPEGEEDT